jgi:cyclophilin family peptidyl-prolyl cis-trans isomerase
MKTPSWLPALLTSLFLVGCGGGNETPPQAPSIQGSNLFYGLNATFSVGVTTLTPGVSLSADKCSNLIQATSSIPTALAFTCKITGTGKLTFTAKDSQGGLLATQAFTVPDPQVQVTTTQGKLVLELNPTAAPLSVDNFLKYVGSGFYTGTIFHRVIPNFVVQAGGFTSGLTPMTPSFGPITLESNNGLKNLKGTLAMARTSDPNSATSQFYVNLVDNTSLDFVSSANPGYAVFGKVSSGFDEVITTIGKLPTGTSKDTSGNDMADVPTTEATITAMTRIR